MENAMQPESILVSGQFTQYMVELLLQRKEYRPEELAEVFSPERVERIERLVLETEKDDAMWPLFGGTLYIGGEVYQVFPYKIRIPLVKKKRKKT